MLWPNYRQTQLFTIEQHDCFWCFVLAFFGVLTDRNLTYEGETTQENPHKKKNTPPCDLLPFGDKTISIFKQTSGKMNERNMESDSSVSLSLPFHFLLFSLFAYAIKQAAGTIFYKGL